MPTLPEIEAAFVKADAAGNAEDAAVFAAEIKRLRAATPAAPERRRALDIMGGDSKMDRDRALLRSDAGKNVLAARGERGAEGALADILMEGGAATAGQLIGAHPVLSVPTLGASIPILGGIFGSVGNIGAQKRRIAAGEQDKFKYGELLGMALASAIPGGPEVSGAKAILKEGGKQAAAGITAKTIETAIDEGRLPGAGEALVSTAIPGVGGALAQRMAVKGADTLNPTKRATLEAGKDAGLVVTPSSVTDSSINKRLESIAGKAAIGQAASKENQEVVTRMAKKALGVPENTDITETVLEDIRKASSAPYAEISAMAEKAKKELADVRKATTGMSAHETEALRALPDNAEKINTLSIQAAADIDALREARDVAKKNYIHYQRSGTPSALDTAELAQETAKILEAKIEKAAAEFGSPDLVERLKAARTRIAKTYDVENALNVGDAQVSARILERALQKGRPLSGELEDIALFTKAFPSVMREGSKIPTPGVSKVEAGLAALLGTAGAAASGGAGVIAGALPLLSGPTRALLLSRPYQALATAAPFAMPNAAVATRELAQSAGQELTPTYSPAEAKTAPPGKFRGTNGKQYEKLPNGKIEPR